MLTNVSAFTREYNGYSKRLETEANIEYKGNTVKVNALWDTGATNTCISTDVVSSLNLVPLGKQQIRTPSGAITVNTFMVDILLPNNVIAKNVAVCDSEIGKQNLGVLIGMDIICLGDFSVSNFNKKTVFTFRTPSQKKTDYVAEANLTKAIGPIHGKGKRKRR